MLIKVLIKVLISGGFFFTEQSVPLPNFDDAIGVDDAIGRFFEKKNPPRVKYCQGSSPDLDNPRHGLIDHVIT